MHGKSIISLCRCTELPPDSPCHIRAAGRNSNYSLPQSLPGVTTDSSALPLWVAVLDTLTPPPNPACLDALLHISCGAVAMPCDPSTQTVLPICDDSCRAYKQLMLDGACDDLDVFLRQFTAASPIPDAQVVVDLYFSFDCDNISTYLFGSYPEFVSLNKCANILSTSLQGKDHTESDEYTLY